MRLRAIAAAIGGFLLIVVLAVLPRFLVTPEALSQRLAERVSEAVGSDLTWRRASISHWFPTLTLRLDDPVLGTGAPVVTARLLEGEVGLVSLVTGTMTLDRIRLIEPTIDLAAAPSATTAGPSAPLPRLLERLRRGHALPTDSGAPADPMAGEGALRIGRLELQQATIRLPAAPGQPAEAISDVSGSLVMRRLDAPLEARFEGFWRGQRARLSAQLGQLLALSEGRHTGLTVTLDAPAVRAEFTGQANMLAGLHLDGAATLSSPSLRTLGLVLRTEPLAALAFGTSLGGRVTGTIDDLQLRNAEWDLGPHGHASGSLQLRRVTGERPRLTGTLAFDRLDMGEAVPRGAGSGAGVGAALLRALDADLRLSARQLVLGPMVLDNVAAGLALHDAVAQVELSSADLFEGEAVGRLRLSADGPVLRADLTAALTGFEAQALSAALGGTPVALSGGGAGRIDVSGEGASAGQLLETLSGHVSLDLSGGVLKGVDLAALLARLRESPATPLIVAPTGQTPFRRLGAELSVHRGVAWLRKVDLDSPLVMASSSGTVDLRDGGLSLSLRLGDARGREPPAVTPGRPDRILGWPRGGLLNLDALAEPEDVFQPARVTRGAPPGAPPGGLGPRAPRPAELVAVRGSLRRPELRPLHREGG